MMRASKNLLVVVFALCTSEYVIQAWTVPHCTKTRRSPQIQSRSLVSRRRGTTTSSLSAMDPASSSSLLVAEESWRQYAPLAVSVIVIVDILLGSPLLNLVVAPMKRQAEGDDNDDSRFASTQQPRVNPKERIDSEQVAQAALDKARNSLELRNYLEAQKTDWDRMEEIRKKMDQDMAKLDETLAEKQRQLEE